MGVFKSFYKDVKKEYLTEFDNHLNNIIKKTDKKKKWF
jgi:hypothetical protein